MGASNQIRQNEIVELLRQEDFMNVSEICRKVFASPATVRRDLSQLVQQHLIIRTRGGARFIENSDEIPYQIRESTEQESKQLIAYAASKLIAKSRFIFLDSSSTCMYLAREILKQKYLTILTNGPKTAQILCRNAYNTIISTGGIISGNTNSLTGNDAEATIKRYNADLFFFSGRSLSTLGVLDSNVEEATIKRVFANHSYKSIVLMDNSKFDRSYNYITLPIEKIDYLIINKPISKSLEDILLHSRTVVINASKT